jgi:hypothetical protein
MKYDAVFGGFLGDVLAYMIGPCTIIVGCAVAWLFTF